ncbi:MAG: sodium:panthothenate symporter [Lentisphaeria bacterium]
MHLIDWCILLIPVAVILILALYSRRYIRGVVDFLAAGRVAGRYVIAVGSLESALSVLMLVALVEAKYQIGYALTFWERILMPLGVIMSLTGYCVYRFRETKALSIGQFLEIRYNRTFRIFAAALRTVAEMLTNAIGPAVAANFIIYFLGLPHKITILGISIPCFVIILAIVLSMSILVIWPAGRVSLLITDCFQGLISYPIFVIVVGYVLITFSWSEEICPVMLDRVSGESFLNPFDIEQLRDFNIFALLVTIFGSVLNRGNWIGNDTTNCARNPHEQKMAGILGAWRNGFSSVMNLLIAIAIITVMSHKHFATLAKDIRVELSAKVAGEVLSNNDTRNCLTATLTAIPEQRHCIGMDEPLSRNENLDTPYMKAAAEVFGDNGNGNLTFQKFRTLYHQMMLPVACRKMFPTGLMGVFALLMIMLLLSTDDSHIFNSSATIIQDVIMPLHKTSLSPERHLRWLRICSLLVAMLFFLFSIFFVHLDYINMFSLIMASLWSGGAGPVMIFGLYSRFGTTAGAFASIFAGSGISLIGLLLQRNWADHVYPFIQNMGWTDQLDGLLKTVSGPLAPYVVWQMDAVKFPINSIEIYCIAMFAGISSYIVVSLITYRHPYNLDRLLHRGQYSIDEKKAIKAKWSWRTVAGKLIGITPEYTLTDRIISWSLFCYTLSIKLAYALSQCWSGICFHHGRRNGGGTIFSSPLCW